MKGDYLVDKSGRLNWSDLPLQVKYMCITQYPLKSWEISLWKIFMCQAPQFFVCISDLRKVVDVCGNKMPARYNRGFYCRSYCLLSMFRAPLCPSSGDQEYYTVVAACGIWCCGFQVVGLLWSWGLCVRFAGCCSIHFLTKINLGHQCVCWFYYKEIITMLVHMNAIRHISPASFRLPAAPCKVPWIYFCTHSSVPCLFTAYGRILTFEVYIAVNCYGQPVY